MEGLQWGRILFEDSFRRRELMSEERQVYDQGKDDSGMLGMF